MQHLQPARKLRQGFTLVEMLTVIAIVGVIAAMAIPSISSVNAGAKLASNQHNAQHVVAIYVAGETAGVVWPGVTRNEKIASVVQGAAPTDGVFNGKIFRVPYLAGADLSGTYPFIGYDTNGDLFYDMAGQQSSS